VVEEVVERVVLVVQEVQGVLVVHYTLEFLLVPLLLVVRVVLVLLEVLDIREVLEVQEQVGEERMEEEVEEVVARMAL